MKITDSYGPGRFGLSFELYPPKTDRGVTTLFQHVDRLAKFRPDYMTCTYGAGGSTQDRTLEVIGGVRQRHPFPVATHLTCVGRTREEIHAYLTKAQQLNIQYVVALRGDPPQGETAFKQHPGGFSYANELVAYIRREFPEMGIAVGGYPETHQEAPSPEVDLENLRRKVDAGADVVITQLFYDNNDYFRFRDQCEAAGITAPIVPGLLPVTNGGQIQRIASLCGARLPQDFLEALTSHEDGSEGQFQVGVEQATRQTDALIAGGAPGIHFYVLNKSEATSQVLSAVDLPARATSQA